MLLDGKCRSLLDAKVKEVLQLLYNSLTKVQLPLHPGEQGSLKMSSKDYKNRTLC